MYVTLHKVYGIYIVVTLSIINGMLTLADSTKHRKYVG